MKPNRHIDAILSAIDRALPEPDEPEQKRWTPTISTVPWWCPTDDEVLNVDATHLLRPRCPTCGEWMHPYKQTDNPTRPPRPNW